MNADLDTDPNPDQGPGVDLCSAKNTSFLIKFSVIARIFFHVQTWESHSVRSLKN